jgi:hypothetical protein
VYSPSQIDPPRPNPYRELLGESFESLHPNVQRAHVAPLSAVGVFDVERGTHWAVPALARMMALPSAGRRQPVVLRVDAKSSSLQWERRIGEVRLRTRQHATNGLLTERHGPGCISFRLRARDGALLYEQVDVRIFGVKVPDPVAPRVVAHVTPTTDGWRVDVTVSWRGTLVCRYAGTIRAV